MTSQKLPGSSTLTHQLGRHTVAALLTAQVSMPAWPAAQVQRGQRGPPANQKRRRPAVHVAQKHVMTVAREQHRRRLQVAAHGEAVMLLPGVSQALLIVGIGNSPW